MSDWKVYVPGIGSSRGGLKDVLTDTGVQYVPKDSLMLCTAGGYEPIGLLYAKCSSLANNVHPWITCGHCGEPLLEVVLPALPPRVLQVNWDKCAAIPAPEVPVKIATVTLFAEVAAPSAILTAPKLGTPAISRGRGGATNNP